MFNCHSFGDHSSTVCCGTVWVRSKLCSSHSEIKIVLTPLLRRWDPLVRDCWYTNDNQQQRLAWQIGTQLVWTGLTVTGEVVTACTVTFYMLRVHVGFSPSFHTQPPLIPPASFVIRTSFLLRHLRGCLKRRNLSARAGFGRV